jgi:dUTP pyrophosphatase
MYRGETHMMFTKVRDVKSPARGTEQSAGLDFFIPNDTAEFTLLPGGSVNIPSGIKVMIPYAFAGIFFNKSGVGSKGVIVGACVVDSDYRGEVHLNVHNVSTKEVTFKPGQKLVQMLLMPVSMVAPLEIDNLNYDSFAPTQRGEGGFGSTGA